MCTGRDNARYLNLHLEPCSKEAIQLVHKISTESWLMTGSMRAKPSKTHVQAMGAFLGDILKASANSVPSYRQMSRASFSGSRIGYRAFRGVVDGAKAAGLITIRDGVGGGNLTGTATRFVPAPALLRLAEDEGVLAADWHLHFQSIPRPRAIPNPLVLKSASTIILGRKRPGERMAFDHRSSTPMTLAKQVNDINAYFAGVAIDPPGEHYAFQRIFNQGNLPTFSWDKGGRLYSMGDSYQQRKSAERGKMKLNGEPVVEIDIRASFLTILHSRLSVAFDPHSTDPYFHPDIPRHVMKGWVVMTLGHDKFQRAWSSDMIADYHGRTGGKLGKDYPIRHVRAEALLMLPVLNGWESCIIRWGDLQFTESQAVIGTVYELGMTHGVPALPVHDSIIVPISKEGLAKTVLTANFTKHVGVEPALTTK